MPEELGEEQEKENEIEKFIFFVTPPVCVGNLPNTKLSSDLPNIAIKKETEANYQRIYFSTELLKVIHTQSSASPEPSWCDVYKVYA